jgi:uncharacterized damage-inducible protein DinB
MANDGTAPHELPVDGDEVATLLGVLDRNRRTFAWKTGGLDEAGLRATTAASTMTLGGLLKHLALVEADWFAVKLRGERLGEPWESGDWDARPDWEWASAAQDSAEQLYALWSAAVERSRRMVADALAEGDLDQQARFTWPDGRTPNMRRVVIDMVEEYARHVGHADLLREAVDGLVGEDAPRD